MSKYTRPKIKEVPKKVIGTLIFTIIFLILSGFSWWILFMLKSDTIVENVGRLFVFVILFASMDVISVIAGSIFTGLYKLFLTITIIRLIQHAEWKREIMHNEKTK